MVKNLKKLRKLFGVSQQQLADVIGVSKQSINKYENHKIEPDIHTLIKFADYFETSVDYLIGRSACEKDQCDLTKMSKYELNQEEANIISNYRKLSNRQKESIRLIINNYIYK